MVYISSYTTIRLPLFDDSGDGGSYHVEFMLMFMISNDSRHAVSNDFQSSVQHIGISIYSPPEKKNKINGCLFCDVTKKAAV